MRKEWIIVPLAVLMLAGLHSCAPRVITQHVAVHDTTYITAHSLDSIFFRDSIYIREKNDTVYQYVEKWRTRYLQKTDTLYKAVRDTTVVKETVEVPRQKTWWDKTKNYLLIALAALALFAYRKQILKLLRAL